MDYRQTKMVLSLLSEYFLSIKPSETTAAAWHPILERYHFEDARDAAIELGRTWKDILTPAILVEAIQQQRDLKELRDEQSRPALPQPPKPRVTPQYLGSFKALQVALKMTGYPPEGECHAWIWAEKRFCRTSYKPHGKFSFCNGSNSYCWECTKRQLERDKHLEQRVEAIKKAPYWQKSGAAA